MGESFLEFLPRLVAAGLMCIIGGVFIFVSLVVWRALRPTVRGWSPVLSSVLAGVLGAWLGFAGMIVLSLAMNALGFDALQTASDFFLSNIVLPLVIAGTAAWMVVQEKGQATIPESEIADMYTDQSLW